MKMDKKMLSKLKNKMPEKSMPDESDPMFDIDEDAEHEDGGDVDNRSANAHPDAGADERTIARAKDGELSDEGEVEEMEDMEAPSSHEEREGSHEKYVEDCSDEELEAELKKRKMGTKAKGRDAMRHQAKDMDMDHESSDGHESGDAY